MSTNDDSIFTAMKVMIGVYVGIVVVCLAGFVALGYVALHFLHKVW